MYEKRWGSPPEKIKDPVTRQTSLVYIKKKKTNPQS